MILLLNIIRHCVTISTGTHIFGKMNYSNFTILRNIIIIGRQYSFTMKIIMENSFKDNNFGVELFEI